MFVHASTIRRDLTILNSRLIFAFKKYNGNKNRAKTAGPRQKPGTTAASAWVRTLPLSTDSVTPDGGPARRSYVTQPHSHESH